MINVNQNCLIENYGKKCFLVKQEKILKENTKKLINKRLFIILFILYINIQVSINDNPSFITLNITKGNNSIIYKDFKIYLSEVYINEVNMSNIETFYNFTEEVNIVKIVFKSQINNCNKMFMDCKGIYEINFTNFDSSNITNLSQTFQNCNKLKTIDLSEFNVTKVNDISNLFENCQSLTSIDLPDFSNSNIMKMYKVFYCCKQITSLNLSRIDTSKVTDMANMFNECKNLLSLDLSSFNTSKLKNVEGMFNDCYNLTSLDLNKF